MPKAINIIGDRYGRWLVKEEVQTDTYSRKYLCECDCGNIQEVWQTGLRNGLSTSCGCRRDEVATTHGGSYTRIYKIHHTMIQRCTNPNAHAYCDYGGRGITIYMPWMDYETFRDWALSNGYADDLSIDRKNTNGNYTPDNCRWTTRTVQARNQRKQKNTSSQYYGVSLDSKRNEWKATIKHDGKTKFLGRFKTELKAAQARDNYITTEGLKNFPLNKDLF